MYVYICIKRGFAWAGALGSMKTCGLEAESGAPRLVMVVGSWWRSHFAITSSTASMPRSLSCIPSKPMKLPPPPGILSAAAHLPGKTWSFSCLPFSTFAIQTALTTIRSTHRSCALSRKATTASGKPRYSMPLLSSLFSHFCVTLYTQLEKKCNIQNFQ